MAGTTPDLLDTNIFIHLVRDDDVAKRLIRERQLLMAEKTPAYCIVSEGEIRSLAYQFNWDADKVEKMRFLLH